MAFLLIGLVQLGCYSLVGKDNSWCRMLVVQPDAVERLHWEIWCFQFIVQLSWRRKMLLKNMRVMLVILEMARRFKIKLKEGAWCTPIESIFSPLIRDQVSCTLKHAGVRRGSGVTSFSLFLLFITFGLRFPSKDRIMIGRVIGINICSSCDHFLLM